MTPQGLFDVRWLAKEMDRVVNTRIEEKTILTAHVDRELTLNYIEEVTKFLSSSDLRNCEYVHRTNSNLSSGMPA
jgi:hypothetical protein